MCTAGVGMYNGATDVLIGDGCFNGKEKYHDGIAWIILHQVIIKIAYKLTDL